MSKIAICKVCKEKSHYALKMCRSCYKKYKVFKAPTIICAQCGKKKKIYCKDMCKTCYEKIGRNKRNNLGTCKICNKQRVIKHNLCVKCTQKDMNIIKCISCKKDKPLFAKSMCKNCYNSAWEKNKKHYKCDVCDQIKSICSTYNGNKCMACYCNDRKEKCSKCNRLRIVNTRDNGRPICAKCNEKHRLKKCSICKEYKAIAKRKENICYDCYYEEYNSRPEVIARKYFDLSNRKKLYEKGNFSKADWLAIMNQFKWRCFYCNIKLKRGTRTVDHIIPITKNGKHIKENIIPCCRSCNSRKNNMDPSMWMQKIGLEGDKFNYIINSVKKMGAYKND